MFHVTQSIFKLFFFIFFSRASDITVSDGKAQMPIGKNTTVWVGGAEAARGSGLGVSAGITFKFK